MDQERQKILDLIDKHAAKAAASEYDRSVCISAISSARDVVRAIPDDIPADKFREIARKQLAEFVAHYNDPDGQYTNGRSVLVPLLDDILTME